MPKYTTSKSVYVGFLHTECAAVCQHFGLIFSNIGWGGKYSERPHRFWSCWNRSERAGSFAFNYDCQGQILTPCRRKREIDLWPLLKCYTIKMQLKSAWRAGKDNFGSVLFGSQLFFLQINSETKVLGLPLVRDDTLCNSYTERDAIAISNSYLPAVCHDTCTIPHWAWSSLQWQAIHSSYVISLSHPLLGTANQTWFYGYQNSAGLTKLSCQWPYILRLDFPAPIKGQEPADSFIYLSVFLCVAGAFISL